MGFCSLSIWAFTTWKYTYIISTYISLPICYSRFFVFDSISLFREVASDRGRHVPTQSFMRVNAGSEGKQKNLLLRETCGHKEITNQQHHKPCCQKGRAAGFAGVQTARLLSLYVLERRAYKSPCEPPVCALTRPQSLAIANNEH